MDTIRNENRFAQALFAMMLAITCLVAVIQLDRAFRQPDWTIFPKAADGAAMVYWIDGENFAVDRVVRKGDEITLHLRKTAEPIKAEDFAAQIAEMFRSKE